MSKTLFPSLLKEKGIELSEEQLKKFQAYYETLAEWNEKMNLTAITEEDGVYLKHFYDSLSASFYYDFSAPISVVDVGAGAGFPSIPLKIVYPHIKVTIVDSLKKRITFLEHLREKLALDGVSFYHDRAETFGKKAEFREQFDVAIARAVARMPVLAELCLPLAKVGGHFLAMKGADVGEELKEGEKAIRILGGKIENTFSFQLPLEESMRNIIVIKKEKKTPKKYPRKPGTPNKQPLV